MTEYRCPGEPYTISRAVHVGRLASYYPKCRQCPHQRETATLSSTQVKRLKETWQREEPTSLLADEGFVGVFRNELTPAHVREFAAALAAQLSAQAATPDAVRLVVASDGRPQAPELVAAVVEGVRWSGGNVVDVGRATSGCLASAIDQLRADGGLLVGNPTGDVHRVGLKLWGRCGQPFSAGGPLEEIARQASVGVARPTRTYGLSSRAHAEVAYLANLEPYFHALRPLRFVLETGCRPLVDWLERLTASVACQFTPATGSSQRLTVGSVRGTGGPTPSAPIDRARLEDLGRQVRAEQAHFGLWIDGDGEICRLVDEQGRKVAAESLLLILARYQLAEQPDARVVLEHDTSEQIAEVLRAAGPRVVHSGSRRAEMHLAMLASGAPLGGGPSGRIWFGGRYLRVDALQTVALLLTVLSQSDLPLSEVVAGSLERTGSSR